MYTILFHMSVILVHTVTEVPKGFENVKINMLSSNNKKRLLRL